MQPVSTDAGVLHRCGLFMTAADHSFPEMGRIDINAGSCFWNPGLGVTALIQFDTRLHNQMMSL